MEFQIITPNRFEDVILHLRNTFFSDEPLNKAVKLCLPGEGHVELERHSLATLNDGLSVMAVTSDDQIAGVALNGILNRGDIDEALLNLNSNQDEQFKKIFHLLYKENLKLDLFDKFNVDQLFEIRILSVDQRFRGQGLAKDLLKNSEKIALKNGYKIMKTDATGLFSQKISSSLGFETCLELCYDNYKDENNLQIFRVEPPHEKLKIMYKNIV